MINRYTVTAAIAALVVGGGAALAQSTAPDSTSSSMAPSSSNMAPSSVAPAPSSMEASSSTAPASSSMASSPPASASTSASDTDSQFLTNAIETDDEEIALGGIALARSTTTAVRDFGLMLIQDHRHSRIEAENIANKDGVQIPPDLAPDAVSELQKLMGLSGDAFDQEFASAMVTGHTQAISAFEDEAKGKGRAANFAEHILPTLRKHLKMAQELQARANGSSSAASSSIEPSSQTSSMMAPSSLEPLSSEPAPSAAPASSSSAI